MEFSALVKILLFVSAVVLIPGDKVSAISPLLDSADTTEWTVNFVEKHGYKIETHEVTTEDGYILTLHRIPSTKEPGGRPVLLHHGFLARSADFVVLGPQNSLGFILADKGFDVWIANARGTTNSKKHVTLSPKSFSFWDFSWHEVGYYDLPAEIDYILKETDHQKLTYVGFSMGTTVFFVLASTRPEYNDKVDQMIALGPVAFMENVRGPVLKYITPLLAKTPWVASVFGNAEFLPTNKFLSWAAQKFCANDHIAQKLCKNVLFLLYGFNRPSMKGELVERIFEYSPSGGSLKEFLHFGQLVNAGSKSPVFRQFDHSFMRNYLKYGQFTPPDYPLSKITMPVHLFMGKNDWFAAPQDVRILAMHLSNTPTVKLLEGESVNHFDFVYSYDMKKMCYDDVINIIEG